MGSHTIGESPGTLSTKGFFEVESITPPYYPIVKYQYNHSPLNTNFGVSSDINDNDWIGVICEEKVFFAKIVED